MLQETAVSQVAPAWMDAVVSYRETETSITVKTARIGDRNLAKCYSASTLKRSPPQSARRVGPPDIAIVYSECDID